MRRTSERGTKARLSFSGGPQSVLTGLNRNRSEELLEKKYRYQGVGCKLVSETKIKCKNGTNKRHYLGR